MTSCTQVSNQKKIEPPANPPSRGVWFVAATDRLVQAVAIDQDVLTFSLPLKTKAGLARDLAVSEDKKTIVVALGRNFSVAYVDTTSGAIRRMQAFDRRPIEQLVRKSYPKILPVLEIDIVEVELLGESLVLGLWIQAQHDDVYAVFIPQTGQLALIPHMPTNIRVIEDKAVVLTAGPGAHAVVYDGKQIQVHPLPGYDAADITKWNNRIIVSLPESGVIQELEPDTFKPLRAWKSPYPRPTGIATWNGSLLLTASSQDGRYVLRFDGIEFRDEIKVEFRHLQDIVVVGDHAYVNSVDDNTVIVIDLQNWRIEKTIATGGYPSSLLSLAI